MTAPQPMPEPPRHAQPSTPETQSAESPVSVFDSVGLLQGGREIMMRHASECYRLRHTRNDKLILTK